MASGHVEMLKEWYCEGDHPIWYGRFSYEDREQMIEDDLSAGYRIPLLLFGIICIGVTMMAVSVLAAL